MVDCVDTSCPSDLSTWTIQYLKFIFGNGGGQVCDLEIMEEGEEPPPRPKAAKTAKGTKNSKLVKGGKSNKAVKADKTGKADKTVKTDKAD